MIPVSVLLILVAVTLLVLGLAGGSSILLIGSIVASLLAAVALVLGARQTATMRRAAKGMPTGPAGAVPVDEDAGVPVDEPFAEPAAPGGSFRGPSGSPAAPGGAPDPSFADNPPAPDEGLASPPDAKPRVASPEDAAAALAADAEFRRREAAAAAGGSPSSPVSPADPARPAEPAPAPDGPWGEPAPEPGAAFAETEPAYPPGSGPYAEPDDLSYEARGPAFPDSDRARASSYIGGARAEDPGAHAWRRAPSDDAPAEAGAAPAGAGFPGGDYAEPEADDPDDEPPPQAVRPADAVQVARMTTEVLVVDGRPRYHLADCPHLRGRAGEPLPVSEAVELGFSPCGLCRPVDRLVARAARR